MQLTITTQAQTTNTQAAKAYYVKADVMKKITLFAAILTCILVAVNM